MTNTTHMAESSFATPFSLYHGVFGFTSVLFLSVYFFTNWSLLLIPYGLFALVCAIGNLYFSKRWTAAIWILNVIMAIAHWYKNAGAL